MAPISLLISSSAVATAATIATAAIASTPAATTVATAATVAATAIASATAAATVTTATAATVATATIASATAAAISAAATPVATVAAALAATATRLIGFFDGHFLTADGCIVQCLNRSAGLRLVGHIYKPEAFTLPRLPIHHHFRKIHRAVQFKHFFQVRIVKITGKTCYKKLHADRFKR